MALQIKDYSVSGRSQSGILYTYILRVTEDSVDQERNLSVLSVQAILKQSYSGTGFSGWGTGVSCTINGKNIFSDYRQRKISGTQEHIFYSCTVELPHEADGSLRIQVGGRLWQNSSASYTPPTLTITENAADVMVLTPIPRASRISATSANIEETAMIVIGRKKDGFTHSVAYRFGALQGFIRADGVCVSQEERFGNTSIGFLLPAEFYAQIPNAPSGVCTLTCTTYSGDEKIGQAQTCSFTVTAAQSRCDPEITASVVDANAATKLLTGDERVLVKFASTAVCQMQAQAKNSAQITQMKIGAQDTPEGRCEIPCAEQDSFTFYAKDSRGYQNDTTVKLQMVPYVKLTNHATASRINPQTGSTCLTLRGNCYCGSFGLTENALTVKYRLPGEEFVSFEAQIAQDHTYCVTVELSGLNYLSACSIETVVCDKLSQVEKTLTAGQARPVFDWGESYFNLNVPLQCANVSGAVIKRCYFDGTAQKTIQSKFADFAGNGYVRQSVFIFGNSDHVLVQGVIGIANNGRLSWQGTQGVALTAGTAGEFTLTLPATAYDPFLMLSCDEFTIL